MKRISEPEIRRRFSSLPRAQRSLLLAVRRSLLEIIPACNEYIKWNALSYQKEEPDGAIKGGICQLCPRENHVELGFVHGSFLPDPSKLLRGGGKYKRHLRLSDPDDLKSKPLIALILASKRFDPYRIDNP